jgi:hypothetical protein
MGHPAIENSTPFVLEPLFLADEDMRPLFVPLFKATYTIADGRAPQLADKQVPVNLSGEHWAEPEVSSYRYEPEVAFTKPATDVVLIGHAQAAGRKVSELQVGLRVGPLKKLVQVFGDRIWYKTPTGVAMTRPRPFERMPLIYERAFGGWDRSHADPEKHTFEPRNPVGTGFRAKRSAFEEGVRLPNLEDPERLVRRYTDHVPPVGFGFTSPSWQPRATHGGTYDEAWAAERMPLLPKDFDRRFFNAAPVDQVAPGYLTGDEPVVVANASPSERLRFHLPAAPAPECLVEVRGRKDSPVSTRLDTVIINTDEGLLMLLWRGLLPISSGPEDVVSVRARLSDAA